MVKTTTNYNMFKILPGNRKTGRRYVERLKVSLSEKNLLDFRPILVNKNYEIIDGQNRKIAAQELGLPIPYIIADNLDLTDVQRLNQNSKNWSGHDYLDSWCALENEEYVAVKKFYDKWGLGLRESTCLLSGNAHAGHYTKFKTGTFKIKNLAAAEKVASMIYDFEPYYDGFKRRNFVYAVNKLCKHPKYNHRRMMKKVKLQPRKLVHCSKTDDYVSLLIEIHDYFTKKADRIREI